MYKVILIDDEPLARQLIAGLLKPFTEMEVVASCSDGFEGFKAIQELKPDLIFLDIQMPRLTGFEMLELIDTPPGVIFTTAFDEYAVKAFESHAVDYLLKPIVRERFEKSVKKWLSQAPKETAPVQVLMDGFQPGGYQHRIVVKDKGMIRIIPAGDIHYVEACDDYLKIFTKEGHFLKKGTLSSLESSLDPRSFVRVHRSFFIPVNQLLRIEPYEKDGHIALLHCGARVQVSKTGMGKLKTLLGW
jgi:two-component system, LytTR family, response regulator